MCGDPEKTDSDNGWTLTPLTPEYNEQEHSCYVRAINTALDKPNIRNIALSGNYGVGKSSILQEVAKQHPKRVIELSLSTLGPAEIGDSSDNAATPTNQIQREIVKQLLYREKPHKTPGSRFRRIERFNLLHELAL